MTSPEVVGLIPAAGSGSRISPLPCSKELYPIALKASGPDGNMRPKVVCQYLLERFRCAGVERAILVIHSGKWDIPTYLGHGDRTGVRLAYTLAAVPYGPPFSLDAAYPFVADAVIAFGFPDILFDPEDAFARLLERRAAVQTDVVLGLFPPGDLRTTDTIQLDDAGGVRRLELKPSVSGLPWTWMIAVWTPRFSRFMHDYLAGIQSAVAAERREVQMGEVMMAAHAAGLTFHGVTFPNGRYLDIGEPEGLARALRETW